MDPSGHDKELGYDFDTYKYLSDPFSLMPKEVIEYKRQKEKAEKEARKNLIFSGVTDVLKGQ